MKTKSKLGRNRTFVAIIIPILIFFALFNTVPLLVGAF